jgi:hypothetical protein
MKLGQLLNPITLPGWIVFVGGFVYAFVPIEILRSWWARFELLVPRDLLNTMQSLIPYIAMMAGFVWIVWVIRNVELFRQPSNNLVLVKNRLKAFANEARVLEDSIKQQKKNLTFRANRSGDDPVQRSAIMQEFQPPKIIDWHEKVRSYIATELGPLEESVFHSQYKEVEASEIMTRYPDICSDYFNAQATHLIHLSRRIGLDDLVVARA